LKTPVPIPTAAAQSTRGSVDNINLMKRGHTEMALAQIDVSYMAYNGVIHKAFVGKPYKKIRAIANLYPEVIHIVAMADSDIKTVQDLKGKRVCVGDLGSGVEGGKIPEAIRILKERWHLLLPIIFIVFLLVKGYTPFKAAFWGILSSVAIAGRILPPALLTLYAVIHAIVVGYFNIWNPEWFICTISLIVGYYKPQKRLTYTQLWDALVLGAKAALGIGAACAAIGFIVGAGLLGLVFTSQFFKIKTKNSLSLQEE